MTIDYLQARVARLQAAADRMKGQPGYLVKLAELRNANHALMFAGLSNGQEGRKIESVHTS